MSYIEDTLLSELRTNRDPGDLWGWVNGWLSAIAETLYIAGEDIPAHWEFRPSPMIRQGRGEMIKRARNTDDNYSYEDETVANLYGITIASADDLRYAGNVLIRYANLVKLAGRDY